MTLRLDHARSIGHTAERQMLKQSYSLMQETQRQSGTPAPLCPSCGAPLAGKVVFCPSCGTSLLGTTGRLPASRVLAGRYRIVRLLARGGMGAVYLAEDLRLAGAAVAVKEMSGAFARGDTEAFARAVTDFEREARLLAGLRHPNLPRVSDRFEEDGKHFLVMEYIRGQTLREMITQAGSRLPLVQALDITVQLCDVLGYLHRQRPPIIYRDLKPANVMIEGLGLVAEELQGNRPNLQPLSANSRVVLIDFGIARFYRPGATGDTAVYGSLGYAPPEQYGPGQTDARTDVYALGVLLHHMLTGHDPAAAPFALPSAIALDPSIPPRVAAAIERATETDPGRRFADVAGFRAALLAPGAASKTVRRSEARNTPRPAQPAPAAHLRQERRMPGWGVVVGLLMLIGIVLLVWLPRGFDPALNMVAPPGADAAVTSEPVVVDRGPATPINLAAAAVRTSATAPPNIDSQGNPIVYDPANATDGQRDTAWRVAGDGAGQWLQLDFAGEVGVDKVGLIPGYDKIDPFDGTDRFAQNRIVKQVRLEFSDGTSVEGGFARSRELQFVQLPRIVRTTWVRIVIVASYAPIMENDQRDFTPISEVVVQGTP
jgi:serine/threonine protein kinase, bacterial